ncbi:MAG TPA: hypothetical protein DCP32_02075 [Anaerolineaceae bacterium]|nr:MAG: hypothetical protein A2X24_02685 [Chloroflexi bacterium GWB2_54_36]HAL15566.1 hypothetical protein [Anaerolineaceae bacterium]
MGEQAAMNSKIGPVKAGTGVHPVRLGIDVPMLLSVAFLLGFGLLMVYSASWQPSMLRDEEPAYYLINQLKWVVVGIAGGTILMYIDYRRWRKYVVPIMIITLGLLVAVLIFGEMRYNSKRTLLSGSIQPSEMAKVVVIMYLSFWLTSKREVLNNINFGLFPMIVILGLTAGLIVLQPDLSATITICVLGVLLFFLAGVEMKQILLIFFIVALLGALVVAVSDTGQMRIQQYVAGLQDPGTASLHIQRSIEAVVRGEFFGVGIGKGSTKFSLPVSHTDSIYAVIAEETGLLGAGAVVILYLVFMWRGLKIASHSSDFAGKLLASGLTCWIVMEAIINMGVMVNLFPFAGNALPFISAGGSSLTMTLGAVGLIFSVARVSSRDKQEQEGRSFGAVVNLRRGDRRGRVSRSHGSAGIR